MGSEMCIRDSGQHVGYVLELALDKRDGTPRRRVQLLGFWQGEVCLLYTSDAADERSSVDLGGRRIIKKKKSTDARCARGCCIA